MKILPLLKRYWFLLGVFTSLALAILLPRGGVLLNPASLTTNTIIVLLFLILGYTLPSESIGRGLRHPSLYLYVQLFIFIAAPLYFFLTSYPFRDHMQENFLIGIYALSCLPTTVSSCIVFTQLSRGNVVGTIINASLANLLGIFLSPFILSILLRETGLRLSTEEMLRVLRSLGLKMLLPIIVGQSVRYLSIRLLPKVKGALGIVSNLLILMVIYFALAGAAVNPEFSRSLVALILPFSYLAGSHLILLALAFIGARFLKFDRENTISVIYTAPQKTAAMGVPLITTIFSERAEVLALALLPVIFYHSWQLLVAALLKETPLVRGKATL